jgi:putative phosphoribosyl transferase
MLANLAALVSYMDQPFRNRHEAGKHLARELTRFAESHPVVLALPRGGVPVAFEVAAALAAPLDVFVVRKLGVPGREELALGAIASGGGMVLNQDVLQLMNVPADVIEKVASRERAELLRRERAYRGNRPAPEIEGKTVILVDDGLATGATMRVAATTLRRSKPARLVVAVPIAAPEACRALSQVADEVVCARTPAKFQAVGLWYQDFEQVGDAEVMSLLELHHVRLSA